MLINQPENNDPLEAIEKEIIEWGRYYGEIYLRFSQVIDRLKDKLPRLRMLLRNRKNLNTYFQRVQETLSKTTTREEQFLLQRKVLNQVREMRSALAHCYTAIIAFEDAFDRTVAMIERFPEDTVSLTTVSPQSTEKMVSEEELLQELQKVHGLISGIDAVQRGVEYSGDLKKKEEDNWEKLRIGDILLKEGIITEEQLNKALIYQKQSSYKEHLGTVLVRLGFVDDTTIAKVLAKQSGYPFIEDLRKEIVHSIALRVIPERMARQHECMPIQIRGNTLRVAIANPYNLLAFEDLKLASNCTLDIIIAPRNQIISMIQRYYAS
ncbi:MAG TPA: hypothetical protein PLA12_08980 [Candidatus Hydrogenedens sp.]|nr:hypothetical protein [Candidatus Hydrogenedens sp.]